MRGLGENKHRSGGAAPAAKSCARLNCFGKQEETTDVIGTTAQRIIHERVDIPGSPSLSGADVAAWYGTSFAFSCRR